MKALRPLIRLILAESRSIHYSKLVKDDISYLFQSDGTIHAVSLYADDGWELLGKMDAQKKFLEFETNFKVDVDKKNTPTLEKWEVSYTCIEGL